MRSQGGMLLEDLIKI